MRANREESPKESTPPPHTVEHSDSPAGGFPDHLLTILVLLWLVTLGNARRLLLNLTSATPSRGLVPRSIPTSLLGTS